MTSFLKLKKYLSVCLLFFTINVTCYANTFESSIAATIYKIIEKEYITKNQKILNQYLSTHSLEDLITSAEKSDRKLQESLFFLYYYYITADDKAFLLENEKLITISDNILLRIKNLIKHTSTPEALFAYGFYQLQNGNYEKGVNYLNKAKEAGYALAYLVPLAFKMTTQSQFPLSTIKGNLATNIENTHQILEEMKERNIAIFGFDILMGMVLFMKNEDSQAMVYFKNAIKNQEFSTAANAYIGLIHDRNNKTKLAKQYLATAAEKGNDVVKSRLLDIYLTEGNYVSAWDLLQEIATHWGKYTDIPAIKASFLISYILAQGLSKKKDLIQSYVWAIRAKAIYDISNNPRIWRVRIGEANRYILYGNTDLSPHIIRTEVDILTNTSLTEHARYTPKEIFELMKIHDKKTDITVEQLQIIEGQIITLTQKLDSAKQLRAARLASNNEFEKLHPLTSSCPRVFH